MLTDPENENRSAEEVAERAIAALDEVRARSHRLCVVGQISPHGSTAPGDRHTVVLGPFSTRGVLDTPEKFHTATQGGSAAKEAGYGLAWDTKTKKGRGRFQLAPAFIRPRDAWDFFREAPAGQVDAEYIRAWIERAKGVSIHDPVCTCGIAAHLVCRFCGQNENRACLKHEPDAEKHVCTH